MRHVSRVRPVAEPLTFPGKPAALMMSPDESIPARHCDDTVAVAVPSVGPIDLTAAMARQRDPALAGPELLAVRLARACAQTLPVAGAGLSVMTHEFRVPLGASDDMASRAERMQFTSGEGPCLYAAVHQIPLVADEGELRDRWPRFAEDVLERTPYRAVITLPLRLGTDATGALDLFLTDADGLAAVTLQDAVAVTEQIVTSLRTPSAMPPSPRRWTETPEPAWLHGPAAQRRATVWIAIGLAMSRFQLTAPDALSLLRAYAYGQDAVLDDVAAALVAGFLDLAQLQP